MQKKIIVFTGGGTGGHLYPLIAIIEATREVLGNTTQVYYLGVKHPLNSELDLLKIPVWTIASSKFRRYFSLLNFVDFFKFFLGIFQALIKLYILMPEFVFSKGGPGALPVILAARFYRIPVYIHESDSIAGLTNKLSRVFAKKIFISFESSKEDFPKNKTVLIGNPIRNSILNSLKKESQEEAKTRLGLDPKDSLILVLGGSQGSVRINNFVFQNIKDMTKIGGVFHQVGLSNIADTETVVYGLKTTASEVLTKYKWIGFLDSNDLSRALTAADLVLSRAGAGSIFEIATFGKPSILIPLQGSAGDHQRKNAYEYEKSGACIVIEEQNLTPGIILQKIKDILKNTETIIKMQKAAQSFARPGSAKIIAEEVLITENSLINKI